MTLNSGRYEEVAQDIRQRTEHAETQCAEQIIAKALERAALEGAIKALENTQPGDYQALRARLTELHKEVESDKLHQVGT